MIRAAAALLLGLTIAAHAAQAPLPVPPIPPLAPPNEDAPVPNLDAHAPPSGDARSSVTLNPYINRRGDLTPGLGFAPGSRYRMDDDRRPVTLPGIVVHVPLRE